ncbi:MAG: ATP-binding protein [Synergistaceae bacterium]|nr:ATP-binding protein [Synergistaceae bacterium]
MLFFKNRSDRYDAFAKFEKALSLPGGREDEAFALITAAASEVVTEAERYSLKGDLWEAFFALLLAEDENPLGWTSELGDAPLGSLVNIASEELWCLHGTVAALRALIRQNEQFRHLRSLEDYIPSKGGIPFLQPAGVRDEALSALFRLSAAFKEAGSPEEMYNALVFFYRSCGSGLYALNRAFRWSRERGLTPVKDLDPLALISLVGYEAQKKELLDNTELFLSGRAANNVLLFGDSGTGKSSSVRALLNEPGFVGRGLRVIEVHKDQFTDIPEILDAVRFRNYRFVIFMDDLSFEEFETDYKHLKAIIEGGIEPKPENAVIYATSNRRNIVREIWTDRKKSSDDVHGGDTMQEKLSLADRFGITIWYGSVGKKEYMEIVRALTEESGLSMDSAELEKLAMRWELEKGSFTGRTARQFVQRLLIGNVELQR